MKTKAQSNFSEVYADVYDLLHRNKPYLAEARFVLDRVREDSGSDVKSILEVACGTGRHLLEFCKEGLFVVGNDLSPAMIEHAGKRLVDVSPSSYRLLVGEMQSISTDGLVEPFRSPDLAIAFYTAMGYLVEDVDLHRFWSNLRKQLKPGAYFFGDLWSGHKMSKDFSPERVREEEDEKLKVMRRSSIKHHPKKNALAVHFDFQVTDKISDRHIEVQEQHIVRYHTEAEIRSLCMAYGFELVALGPFFDTAESVEEAWNFYFLARKIG